MNLENINSPVELLLENEKPVSPMEKAWVALKNKELTPQQHLEIAITLVEAVRDFHNWVVENKSEASSQWAVDAQSLHFALCILKTIE